MTRRRPAYVDRQRERYYERKAAGLCTGSPKCNEPIVQDRQMCIAHLEKARATTAASLKRTRAARREDGLCAYCGRVPSEQYACLRCQLLRGLFSSENDNVDENVPLSESDPRFRVSNDGRMRFHGQMKRGRQPVSQLDEQDLESALKQIAKAKDELAKASSDQVANWPRHERENAKRAALAMAEHGTRFVDEVLERHRFVAGMELTTRDANRRRGAVAVTAIDPPITNRLP